MKFKKFLAISIVFVMILSTSIVAYATDAIDEEEIGYVTIEDGCKLLGDINADEKVAADDARLALRFSAKLIELTQEQIEIADINGDGKVTAADARLILRIAAKLDPLPEHNFGEWVVVEPATCTEDGLERRECPVCGEFETRVIPALTHEQVEIPAVEAKWTEQGSTAGVMCSICEEIIEAPEAIPSKLEVTVGAANEWAAENNLDVLIEGEVEGDKLSMIIKVDGIWEIEEMGSFDGLMTFVGNFIADNFGTDEVSIDGQNVYVEGKMQNTAVKNVIFSVGDGFFYKIANLEEDGVYGVYDVVIAGEEVEFTVKFDGTPENMEKITDFAGVIADHIYADTSGTDLIIGIKAPDAFENYLNSFGNDDMTAQERLNAQTIASGLGLMANLEIDQIFGSQQSAVNKVLKLFCDLSGVVNKVVDKVESATVTLANGDEVNLFNDGAQFEYNETTYGEGNYYSAFMSGIQAMISDELKEKTVGEFAYVDGAYEIPVSIEVSIGNLGDIASTETIKETIIIRLYIFGEEQPIYR